MRNAPNFLFLFRFYARHLPLWLAFNTARRFYAKETLRP